MIPHKPFIHSLSLLKRERTYGWLSPAEVPATTPQDVGFAVPVDRGGRFNDLYQFEIFKYDQVGNLIAVEAHDAISTKDNGLMVKIEDERLYFREKPKTSRRRSFPYLGQFKNPDFHYRLVEVDPEPFDLVDELFLSSRLVLIGCNPSSHYQGWTEQSMEHVTGQTIGSKILG